VLPANLHPRPDAMFLICVLLELSKRPGSREAICQSCSRRRSRSPPIAGEFPPTEAPIRNVVVRAEEVEPNLRGVWRFLG
jgi:hypothetical protein